MIRDADLAPLQGKKVAVIGYGSQGHAHATTCVTAAWTSSSVFARRRLVAEGRGGGFRVMETAEAAKRPTW